MPPTPFLCEFLTDARVRATTHRDRLFLDACQKELDDLRTALAETTKQRGLFLYERAEDGSPEAIGFELINGKTEEYVKEMWQALIEALRARFRGFK